MPFAVFLYLSTIRHIVNTSILYTVHNRSRRRTKGRRSVKIRIVNPARECRDVRNVVVATADDGRHAARALELDCVWVLAGGVADEVAFRKDF